MTKAEIIAQLDELSVPHKPAMKKAELERLLSEVREAEEQVKDVAAPVTRKTPGWSAVVETVIKKPRSVKQWAARQLEKNRLQ